MATDVVIDDLPMPEVPAPDKPVQGKSPKAKPDMVPQPVADPPVDSDGNAQTEQEPRISLLSRVQTLIGTYLVSDRKSVV